MSRRILAVFLLGTVAFLVGCGGGSGSSTPASVTITPVSPALDQGQTVTFAAVDTVNNDPSVTWTLSGPGTLSGTTAFGVTYNAPATVTTAATATVTATSTQSSLVSASTTVTVNPLPMVTSTSASVPAGTVNVAYTTTLTSSGGTAPFTWSVSAGALPTGVTLSSAGVLSGTPTAYGSFTFTIQVTDSGKPPVSATEQLTVVIAPPPVSITTTTLPGVVQGTAYSQTLAATGGMAPLSWSVSAGALPTGVTLSGAGLLAGTPTVAGTFNFTAKASDSSATPLTATQALSLVVTPTLAVSTTTLPAGVVTQAYTATTLATTGGTGAVTWAVSSGSVPAGMSLSTAGVLTGTPTTPGTSTFTVKATDSGVGGLQQTATKALSLAINPQALSITTTTLPSGVQGSSYSQTLASTGGLTPISWSVSAGSLPTGVTLSSGGVLSGTPSVNGSFGFTVKATDSSSPALTATQALTLVLAAPPISIMTTTLPGVVQNTSYSQALAATGGLAPIAWSVSAGSLPTGVTLSSAGLLAGTPTVAGTFNFTAKASDSSATPQTATQALSLVVTPTLAITTTTLSSGTVATAYPSTTLQTSGGTGTIAWTLVSGSVPAGMTFTGGVLAGTPTTAGPNSFTVKATDSGVGALQQTATQALTLQINAQPLVITTTTLPGVIENTAYSQTLASSGGVSPIKWSVSVGSLPTGVTLSNGGLLSGSPSVSGTFLFTVKATDSSTTPLVQTQALSLTVTAPLAITTTTLAAGYVSQSYPSTTLLSTGGTGAIAWSVSVGSLPANMSLSSGGAITGTPTAAGTSTFTVKAMDSGVGGLQQTVTKQLSLTIDQALAITTTSLANGIVGTAYTATLNAAGGSGSGYSYTVTSGTGLSAVGLGLSSGGAISGTPTASETSGSFTVKVTDSASNSATATLSLTILPTLSVATSSLPNGIVGTSYSSQLAATGGTNTGYAWTITSGASSLSNVGLGLSTGGVISGTPTAAEGASQFTVQVMDSGGHTATRTIAIIVNYAALSITTTNLPAATVGKSYSQTFNAGGGSGNYSWSVSVNAAGLSGDSLAMSAGGVLSGTPTTAENISFTVKVTDTTTNNTATAPYTLVVNNATATSCTHDGSANAILNGNYAFLLSGFDPNGHHYQVIGDFKANGTGSISNGNADANGDQNIAGFSSGEQEYTFSGNYSIGSADNRGTTTWNNTNTAGTGLPASTDYCFSADSITVPAVGQPAIAYSGRMIEADGSGYVLTGYFQIQDPADFTDTALNGSFAFGAQGVDGPTPNRRGAIGQFALNGSGGVSSGQVDFASYSSGSTTYSAANAITSSGSSYTVASNGRGTLTLDVGGTPISFITYVVGTGNKLLMLSSSNQTEPLLSGQAMLQTTTSYTTANVKATGVYRADGTTDPTQAQVNDRAEVGQLSFDGSGNVSLVNDVNGGGTIKTPETGGTGTATYTVSSTGYLTVNAGAGNTAPNFYLYAPGSGFGLDASTSVKSYYMAAQTIPSGGFVNSGVAGSYSFGTISPTVYHVSGGGSSYPQILEGTVALASGAEAVAIDLVSAPGLSGNVQADQLQNNTYALDATYGATAGRVVIQQSGATVSVGYIVSPTQVFLINELSGQDSLTMEADQTSGITLAPSTLAIQTTSFPAGTVGTSYGEVINVTGGTAPYSVSIVSGSLPPGINAIGCNTTGVCLNGTPTTMGSYSFTLEVSDSESPVASVTMAYTLTINPASPLAIQTTSLQSITVNNSYGVGIVVTGGTTPYTAVISSGALPPGLKVGTCNGTCNGGYFNIYGTPTSQGSYNFTLKVTDSESPTVSVTQAYTIVVGPDTAFSYEGSSLPTGVKTANYYGLIGLSGGISPYTESLISGALPPGLSIAVCTNCEGYFAITGIPTSTGTFNFTLQFTDSESPAVSISQGFSITVNADTAVAIATTSLPGSTAGTAVAEGQPYTGNISVSGGAQPYTGSITSGSLPPGLSVNVCQSNCSGYFQVSGTPTATGVYNFTLKVQDASNPAESASQTYVINVTSPLPLAFGPTSLSVATKNFPYSQQIAVTGGVQPYTPSILSNTLPAGLTLDTSTGIISGTPTATGSGSVTVQITDSASPSPQTASHVYTVTVNSAGANDSELHGSYAFLTGGFANGNAAGAVYGVNFAGSFTADGAGNLTSITLDGNQSEGAGGNTGVQSGTATGIYTIGADNRGTLIFNFSGGGTMVFSVAVAHLSGGIAQRVKMIEFDDSNATAVDGVVASGSAKLQTASAFSLSTLNGGYVFGLQGESSCSSCASGVAYGPVSAVGVFAANGAGTITSGEEDAGITGASINGVTLTGSITAPNAAGRGTITFTPAGTSFPGAPTHFVYYIVSSTELFMMSTDSPATTSVLSGDVEQQQQSTFSNSSLSGTVIAYENSADGGNGSSSYPNSSAASLDILTVTGSGQASLFQDQNDAGSVSSGVQGTASFSIASNGRMTLGGTGGGAPVFYLYGPDAGFATEQPHNSGDSAGLITFEGQSAGPFSNSTLAGSFAFGTVAPAVASTVNSGVAAFSGGSATLTLDQASPGTLAGGAQTTATYTTDATTGRMVVTPAMGSPEVIYIISPTKVVGISLGGSQTQTVLVFEQ